MDDAQNGGAGAAPGAALVLAGAVAKGAFHAGVLSVIAELGIRITKVVGTSSGALNACVYAAGIRADKEREAAERLVQRWREGAGWEDVFSVSPAKVLGGHGLSSVRTIRRLVKEAVLGWTSAGRPIGLDLVVSPLRGRLDPGGSAATTYEHVAAFRDADFDTQEGWDRIAAAAVASAAFPLVFASVEVEGLGPCVDGGAVNNTPIRCAIEGSGSDVVIVVDPHPAEAQPAAPMQGANLVLQLADILIHERLFRDLKAADAVNKKLAKLDALVREGRLSPAVRDEIARAFGWRRVEVITIRPSASQALEGNAFAAFFDAELRRRYIERGAEVARAALAGPMASGLLDGATPRGELARELRATA
ncbi:MAG: patatin-like phospholipase family protein [Polyangiaceae bacterium]|nr:patatin-like phospholipase family protein [Polyangiaceae bacterium]